MPALFYAVALLLAVLLMRGRPPNAGNQGRGVTEAPPPTHPEAETPVK